MRIKQILTYLLINILLINSFTLNLSATEDECYQYTITQASSFDGQMKHQKYSKAKGDATNEDGKLICIPNKTQIILPSKEVCMIKAFPVLDKGYTRGTNPRNSLKCRNFYINVKNMNPSLSIDRLLDDKNFINNANIWQDTENLYETNTKNLTASQRKHLMATRLNAKVGRIKAIQQALSLSSNEEKAKGNFLDNFLDLENLNPLNRISKDAWDSPLAIKVEEEKTQANKIFKKCEEEIQKIPTFSLEDMLNMIKSSVFDLESQIEQVATDLIKDTKDTIQDMVSDQAIIMYTIQALTKIIALAICKWRRFAGVASGKVSATMAATMSSVSSNACDEKLDEDDEADTDEDKKEDSCWALGTIASCFVSAFAGITFSFISTDRESSDNSKKACELLEESVKNEAYNMCMETEPDKVMRYILKIMNLSAKGGEIEVGLLSKCKDEEVEERFKNKNNYDKNGKPNKNRITSFLNQGVDSIQGVRDLMLGYMDDTLEKIKLESLANQPEKKLEDLIKAVKNNLTANDFRNKYPNVSIDMIADYEKKYNYFEEELYKTTYSQNLKAAVSQMVGVYKTGRGNSSSNANIAKFSEILTNSKSMLYRFMATLPAYDYYMNFFIGADISGFYTTNGRDEIAIASNRYSSRPQTVSKLFNISSDNFIEDVNKNSKIISEKLIQSMNDFYEIWNNILIYLSNDFAFNYTSINGKLTYLIPIKDIRNIIKAKLYSIYLERYATKKDSTGKFLKSFNINYILNRMQLIDSEITMLKGSSVTMEEKLKINEYLKEYISLILDYNLYLATYDLTNSFSLTSIIDSANANLQNYFMSMDGHTIDNVQMEFRYFLRLLNQKN